MYYNIDRRFISRIIIEVFITEVIVSLWFIIFLCFAWQRCKCVIISGGPATHRTLKICYTSFFAYSCVLGTYPDGTKSSSGALQTFHETSITMSAEVSITIASLVRDGDSRPRKLQRTQHKYTSGCHPSDFFYWLSFLCAVSYGDDTAHCTRYHCRIYYMQSRRCVTT